MPRSRSPVGDHPARAAALGAGGLLVAVALVAVLRATLWTDGVPDPEPVAAETYFGEAELADGRSYREVLWAFAVALAPLPALVAIVVALAGSRWRAPLLARVGGRAWAAGALFGAGLALVTAAVAFPLRLGRFAWSRAEGPVVQPAGDWLLDVALATVIQAALTAAIGAVVIVLVLRAARWWPAALAGLAAGLVVLGVVASPLVAELFMRTEPLADPALRDRLVTLADRAGVEVDDVRVSDASARTRAPNAVVSGLGGTRRIVLFDTLAEGLPEDQVASVTAHELAHVERRHIEKGTLWAVLLMLPAAMIVAAVVAWRTGWDRPPPGAAGRDLALRRLAVIAATAATLGVLATPLVNWVSRAYEAEADWIMLALTEDPDTAIALRRESAVRSVAAPDPPGAIAFWFGTHPSAVERIGLAERARAEP